MKVHLIASRPTLEKDIVALRQMLVIIEKMGHTLARDWVEEAFSQLDAVTGSAADWGEVYKKNLEAITKADVVIAETSFENFGVGYQVAFAVQLKKPVLLLRHAHSDKNAFVTGVEDSWIKRAEYTSDNTEELIGKFLKENDIQTKDMRFNFFIDRPIYNYLRWAAHKTGKTKAEILRELVAREIDKETRPS